jgi:hypothetical protein
MEIVSIFTATEQASPNKAHTPDGTFSFKEH